MVVAVVVDREWQALKPQMEAGLAALQGLFQEIANSIAPTADYSARTKTRASAFEKLGRKGYASYAEMPDLVRGAVTCDTIADVKQVFRYLILTAEVVKVDIKTGTPDNPCRGIIHVDVNLAGMNVEVQVTLKSTWVIKKQSQAFYKAGNATGAAQLWEAVEQIEF